MVEPTLPQRYELVRTIGFGGMARVVLARDAVLGGECALKIIHPHLASNPQVMERFRLELEVSRRLRHPGIVEVRELHEPSAAADGSTAAFLSMEYLPGGDLKRRILRDGKLSLQEILSIAARCLDALGAAHRAGIVHRDVKPQNILFALDGGVRLSDFGLATVGAEASAGGGQAAAGTPDYCPPEIIRGERADGRSDIYSLGATLFEAATGRVPFQADSPYAAMRAKTESPAPGCRSLDPGLPEWFEAAVAKALERDASERFQTAEAFAACLAAGGAGMSVPAKRRAVPAQGRACPRCGRPVPRSLGYCFPCGLALPALRGAGSRRGSYRVMVTGSGKPGDKLDHAQREFCLRLVEREGVDSSRLRKSIPRAPFVLVSGLTGPSAESIASALIDGGLSALALGRDSSPQDRKLASASQRKRLFSLLPRVYAIIFTTMAGFYGNINAMIRAPGLIPVMVLALLTAPGIALAATGRRSYAKLSGADTAGDPPLLEAAARLRSPSLRGILASIARKADALEDRLEAMESLQASDRVELSLGLREALCSIARTIAAARDEESDRDEGSDRELIRERSEVDAREAQRREEALTAALLSCSASIDSAGVGLSGVGAAAARSDLRRLDERVAEARDLAAAYREIADSAPISRYPAPIPREIAPDPEGAKA
jgi:serine/threonine-protein kinase